MECLLLSKPFPQFQQNQPVEPKIQSDKSAENIKSETIESAEGNEWRSVITL